ncbi:hypothetical protein SteCoe_9630 [Stentor coeruleus]|uniref:DUF3447 domain-containing protein n=1 Tax=Stentor coeruleus TaxID=5963 RepID=A0A1R2CHD2_9CILI|nr:hypothetical protein SteCoe_9630 [Stentor coeruleus]
MGCCESKNLSNRDRHDVKRLEEAIMFGDNKRVIHFLNRMSEISPTGIDINDFTFYSGKITLNIPGFCILHGKHELFQELYENYFISIHKLEENFGKYGLSALTILCSKGYYDLLKYYLPLSLSIDPSIYLNSYSLSALNLPLPNEKYEKITYTPIQLACFYGHINCVKTILDYFHDSDIPWWMSINYPDTTTGENCALISCRGGNFPIIKYLYTHCDADYKQLSATNENALQLFLSSSKSHKTPDILKIVWYLLDMVKIDLNHNIEKTLSICQNKEAYNYIKSKHQAETQIFFDKLSSEKTRISQSSLSLNSIFFNTSSISSFHCGEISDSDSFLRN